MMDVAVNGGGLKTQAQGEFGSFNVWFHPNALANMLSFSEVAKKCHILCGHKSNQFSVKLDNGAEIRFKLHKGLHACKLSDLSAQGTCLVNTV